MEKAKYYAIDIARFTVNFSHEIGIECSNLKLQKLLYFIQRAFIIVQDKPCFEEKIEAWAYGPVVPEVYQEFRKFGSSNIPKIECIVSVDLKTLTIKEENFDDNIISDDDKQIIKKVVDIYRDMSAISMANLTHNQSPWKKSYIVGYNNEIPIELIKDSIKG